MYEYPQPEVVTPPEKTTYYIVDNVGRINTCRWDNESGDIARLANYKVYLTAEAAKARFEWDLQEAKKRTVPAWFQALEPRSNIEYKNCVGTWCPLFESFMPADWSKVPQTDFRAKPDWLAELGPEVEIRNDHGVWIPYMRAEYCVDHNVLRNAGVLFRAKRKPVTKTINGVRFSWPATVQRDDLKGPRHRIDFDGYGALALVSSASWCNEYGPYVHETREGALEHIRALTSMES